jgi:glutaredoxin
LSAVPRILTLYSKPGCHLCEDVRDLLDEVAGEFGLAVTTVDITTDEALFAAYRYEIPVVTCEGREVARGRIAEAQLLAALRRLGTED